MKTVITYGVFDMFHEGHASLLQRAKALGDRLIVGVTTDQFALQRGKLNLIEPLEKRMNNVRACPFVDGVIVEDHFGQKVEDIERYHADVFAIGDDWLGKFDYLKKYCDVVYLKRTPGISSSSLREGRYPRLLMGVIGCGRIAGRFFKEAGYVREVLIPAMYHPAPDASESVRRFRSEHTGIAMARTLEKLFDQVDAVYIASPHGTHYAYAKAALQAGRHVLCEKPLAFGGERARELYDLANRQGCVLMEAIKTAYCPGFQHLISIAKSGEIGEIRDIRSCFTRLTPKGFREWTDKACGGSFTEFGSYTLLPAVKLLGTEGLSWDFRSVREDGVDSYTVCRLQYENKMAEAVCGIGAKTEGSLVISGTRGYLIAEAPWWKTQYFEIRGEDPNYRQRFCDPYDGDGLRYEISDFLHRVRGYGGREYKLTEEESVCMAEIMGNFLKASGRAPDGQRMGAAAVD